MALPFSGTARTRAFKTDNPLSRTSTPATRSWAAFGVSRTCTIRPSATTSKGPSGKDLECVFDDEVLGKNQQQDQNDGRDIDAA